MLRALGLIEFNSIAKGIEGADAMVKAAQVEMVEARPTCPGKYVVFVAGDVAAVDSAVAAGKAIAEQAVLDDFILPNVHPSVVTALAAATPVAAVAAIGIIETFSIAALIVAADAAAKAAAVELLEVRPGVGIGGKAFVTLTGDVASVRAAVEAGAVHAAARGMLVEKVVIPSPHASVRECLL